MEPVVRQNTNDPLESALDKLVSGSLRRTQATFATIIPAFDVKITETETTVLIDLPGVDEDDISIEANEGTLCVSVSREFDHDAEDAEEYTAMHRPYGTFACTVSLPTNADGDGMTAKYKRGVLKVRIPVKRANVDRH